MRRLEIVDVLQERKAVKVRDLTKPAGTVLMASGETVSHLAVRPEGTEKVFLVRIPEEMLEHIGMRGTAPERV